MEDLERTQAAPAPVFNRGDPIGMEQVISGLGQLSKEKPLMCQARAEEFINCVGMDNLGSCGEMKDIDFPDTTKEWCPLAGGG